jgi:diguanylate cyclase (GGDEF)-like protein
MRRLRHGLPLVISALLVLTTGAVGIAMNNRATDKAETVVTAARDQFETALASLGKQYVLFSLKEGLDYAATASWDLEPGDPGDVARLRAFVDHAALINYGAALVSLDGRLISAYSAGNVLPAPSDPRLASVAASLRRGQPGISPVLRIGRMSLVALAVPVLAEGRPVAVFVGFVCLDDSALETYVEHLHFGKTGRVYVLDAGGTVVAASDPTAIGHFLAKPTVLAAEARGAAAARKTSHGATVAYAPLGVGGWSGAIIQDSGEFYGPTRSGHVGMLLAILGLLVAAAGVVAVVGARGESARRRLQDQLTHKAYHDDLTALPNRALFNRTLREALTRTDGPSQVTVFYVDVDDFKRVNDRRGHEAGDALLIEVAERLRRAMRADDLIARLGGDEFAVLSEHLPDPEAASRVAARVAQQLGRPFALGDEVIEIGASVGVAVGVAGHSDPEDLLHHADQAMYRAKTAGKGGYHAASPAVPADASSAP